MNIADDLKTAYEDGYKRGWNDGIADLVHCKDCIYWQKPQVKLEDGTYRDYKDGEEFPNVPISIGINVSSFCALYNKHHENDIPQFMDEDDFCSKGSSYFILL